MVEHYLVYGIRKINTWQSFKSKKQKVIESCYMRKYNKAHFRNDIQQIEWETILSLYCHNTTDMATTVQDKFESILDIHALLRRKRFRINFTPWLTPSLKRSILERDKLKVQAKNSPDIWPAYKRKCNQVIKRIRISIRVLFLRSSTFVNLSVAQFAKADVGRAPVSQSYTTLIYGSKKSVVHTNGHTTGFRLGWRHKLRRGCHQSWKTWFIGDVTPLSARRLK